MQGLQLWLLLTQATAPLPVLHISPLQSPLWRKTPKIGYMAKWNKTPLESVNLDALIRMIDTGRINPKERVTMKTLLDCGLCSDIKYGVKLLARVSHGSGGAVVVVLQWPGCSLPSPSFLSLIHASSLPLSNLSLSVTCRARSAWPTLCIWK